MFSLTLSARSITLVRQRYTELAQRVLHDAEELALGDQRSDPNADEALISLLMVAPQDPLLSEFLGGLDFDRLAILEVLAARLSRRNGNDVTDQENSDAYRTWVRVTAMTSPVDLRVMLSSLLISDWLSAVSRVVLEQAGITHERLIDDLQRRPSGDSAALAALLGADPAGPPLGRLINSDEAGRAIGRTRLVSAAAARFRVGDNSLLAGKRGVGKAVLARAAVAASGRLGVEVPMSVLAHLDPAEIKARLSTLAGYLAARDGGLLLTDANKSVDELLATWPANVPLLITAQTGIRLPQLAKIRTLRRLNVPVPSPDLAWQVLGAWAARADQERRLDPGALLTAIALAQRFAGTSDTALPGSAIELVRQARPIRRDGVIDEAALEAAVSVRTGLPASLVSERERTRLNDLVPHLQTHIVGQLEAIEVTARVVRRRAVRLGDEKRRPIGVFLFLGPTGVGKTELARACAKVVYGSEEALVKFNMGDYRERHEIAKLIGSPPGYLGSEEEGELSTKTRALPDGGVLLLDEWEKAHDNVSNLMLAVFDDGIFAGNKGKPVDLANWIIVMTSNLGSELKSVGMGFGGDADATPEEAHRGRRANLVKDRWRPEFLNRIHAVVHFASLSVEELEAVLRLRLATFCADLASVRLAFRMGPNMRRKMAAEAFASGFGGRDMILRRFPEEVEDRFADLLLGDDYRPESCYVLELDDAGVPALTRLLPGERGWEAPWSPPAPKPAPRHSASKPEPVPQSRSDVMRA